MKHLLTVWLLIIAVTGYTQPNLQFSRSYGGNGIDSLASIVATRDGGYIMAGISKSPGTGYHGKKDALIIKTTSNGTVQWKRYCGGSEDDIARSIIETRDGYFVFTGSTFSIDGDVTDHGREIFKSPALIDTLSYTPFEETWTVKLDASGNIAWSKCYSKTIDCLAPLYTYNPNYCNKIIETKEGGYLLAGAYPSNNLPCENYPFDSMLLVKMSSNGLVSWARRYVGAGNYLQLFSVIELSNGYAAVGTGSWQSSPNGAYYYTFFLRTDISGNMTQSAALEGAGKSSGTDLKATSDGGFIIAGTAAALGGDWTGVTYYGGSDYFLAKLSSAGVWQWKRKYGGSQNDAATCLQVDTDGGFIVGGYAESADGHVTDHSGSGIQKDYWLMKASSGGTFIWGKSFGGTRHDYGTTLYKTADAGLVFGGASYSMDAGFTNQGACDYWMVKLDSCGSTAVPRVPVSQSFCSSSAPKVSNLYAVGTNIKWYTTATGGSPLPSNTPLTFGTYYASQTPASRCESARVATMVTISACRVKAAPVTNSTVYPNPSTGLVNINVQLSDEIASQALIVVKDVVGKTILTQKISIGKGHIQKQLDMSKLPNGTYFITCQAGTTQQVMRVVISK